MGNCMPKSNSAVIVPICQKRHVVPNCKIEEDGEKGVIRVKMVMTKREAIQFLAQVAKNSPVITGGDLRRRKTGAGIDSWRPELESISEN